MLGKEVKKNDIDMKKNITNFEKYFLILFNLISNR